MENAYLIDWLTFSSKIDSVDSLIEFLGLEGVQWEERSGRFFYRSGMAFQHINIYYNGINEDMGVCVDMSGQGCRDFETHGGAKWADVFRYIRENENDVVVSRVDIAFDCFDSSLDLDALVQSTFDGLFVSRMKHWNVQKGSRGTCIEHGLRSSNTFIRIYDKKAERQRDDLESWVRCEIQIRGNCAKGFAAQFEKNTIDSLFFRILNNYLRYVKEKTGDSNRWRWEMSENWANFIKSVEKCTIFIAPGVEYNELRLHRFVYQQAGNAIKLMIELHGADTFLNGLDEFVKPSKNPNYRLLRQSYRNNQKIIAETVAL